MPYIILPKGASTPTEIPDPLCLDELDIWERPPYWWTTCPVCRMTIPGPTHPRSHARWDHLLFGFGQEYLCAICSIRRFKAAHDAVNSPCVRYASRADAHAASTPSTERVEYVRTSRERLTWHNREGQRVIDGPAHDLTTLVPTSHFLHMSETKPGLFAFTKDDEHGYLDKQTVMKPGKYLTTFCPSLPLDVIAARVAACAAYALETFSLATSEADITAIFNSVSGPDSCMQRKAKPAYGWQRCLASGKLPCHPATVYANSDLAIAYLGPLDAVSQRAVVWPAEKRYCNYDKTRIYGTGPLETLLQRAGYTAHPDAFHGARIRRIPYRNGVVVPYIDGACCVYDTDDPAWLMIEPLTDRRGLRWYPTDTTEGYAGVIGSEGCPDEDDEDDYIECDRCGGSYHPDDFLHGCCYDCRHSWLCAHCDTRIFDDTFSTDVDDEQWCDNCRHIDAQRCEDCGDYFDRTSFSREERQHREAEHRTEYCADCAPHWTYCKHCANMWNNRESEDCPDADDHFKG